MQQYILSPVVNDANGVRLKATDQITGGAFTELIPSDPTTGQPLFTWGLCMVNAVDLTTVVNDVTNHPLPQITLDALWSTVAHATRLTVETVMTTNGISTAFINKNTSMRDIVNAIGKFLDPVGFDANRFSA